MKKGLFIFLLWLSGHLALAQTDSITPKVMLKPQFKFGLSTQSSYSSFGEGASAFGNYVIPSFSYTNGGKWQFEGAVALGKTNLNGFDTRFSYNSPGSNSINGSANNISFYTKGLYNVNSKLSIQSVVYRNANNAVYMNANPRAFDFSNSGVELGMTYKFSDHFLFNAGISFNKGYNPLLNNMYGHQYGNSLFDSNGFNSSIW
jgi:hypothetical protein